MTNTLETLGGMEFDRKRFRSFWLEKGKYRKRFLRKMKQIFCRIDVASDQIKSKNCWQFNQFRIIISTHRNSLMTISLLFPIHHRPNEKKLSFSFCVDSRTRNIQIKKGTGRNKES